MPLIGELESPAVRVVVTGAAGFIGSHVAQALSDAGHDVLAVDALARSTSHAAAAENWAGLAKHGGITLVESDLVTADLRDLTDAEVIVHLAGRSGIRTSWGDGAAAVQRDNVRATRRLLAACAARPVRSRPRVVVASSSSVYGSATRPCAEGDALNPESPYAAAKLTVERLSGEAARSGVPTVILRLFSVYGPRQRPDMAFHRFIEAALDRRAAPVFGDGTQTRAFTYVADVVRAVLRAVRIPLPPAMVINVGHPATAPLGLAISRIEALLGGRPLRVTYDPVARGDADRTWAATSRAAELLGWTARTGLDEGLAQQIAWHRERRGA
jgi:nucleoside-diphosphate-sugar epimerase